jgi:cell division septal protein FtsQ
MEERTGPEMMMFSKAGAAKRRQGTAAVARRAKRSGQHPSGSPATDLLRRTALVLLLFLGAAGLLAGTVYGLNRWAKCCTLFVISKVKVEGADRLDPAHIKKLSGIKEGDNIFSFDAERIAHMLKEQEPWIREADIGRKLPDTVVIEIKERKPAALVRIGGTVWIMDSSGHPFKVATKDDDFTAPIITGAERKIVSEGHDDSQSHTNDKEATKEPPGGPERIGLDPEKLRDALTIVRLSRKGARALGFYNISQIDFPGDDAVVIYTADKAVPFYLDRDQLKSQFYRAEKILYQLYTSGEYAKVASVTVGYGEDTALAVLKKTGARK